MSELKRLPIGVSAFSEIIERGLLYVDKTDLIAALARADNAKAFFLQRPRGFGKTLLLDTFHDLFSNGLKNFQGLKIERQKLWPDRQTYPVLRLNFSGFAHVTSVSDYKRGLYDSLNSFVKKHNLKLIVETEDPVILAKNIFELSSDRNLVLLIDDFDAPFNCALPDRGLREDLRRVYTRFLATVKSYGGKFRFIFITGITKFTDPDLFSPVDQGFDLSLDNRFQTLSGFTDEELKTGFAGCLEELAALLNLTSAKLRQKIRDYYGGFCFWPENGIRLCRPAGVINFLSHPGAGFRPYRNAEISCLRALDACFDPPLSPGEIMGGLRESARLYDDGCGTVAPRHAAWLTQFGCLTFGAGSNEKRYMLTVPNQEAAELIKSLAG